MYQHFKCLSMGKISHRQALNLLTFRYLSPPHHALRRLTAKDPLGIQRLWNIKEPLKFQVPRDNNIYVPDISSPKARVGSSE